MIQTLCPACGTAFRVTAEQLKAKQGKVRCGKCQHVFNAIETLLDVTAEPVPQTDTQLEFAGMAGSPAETPGELGEQAVTSAQAGAEIHEHAPDIEPLLHEPIPEKRPRRAWPWALASLLPLLLLLLQAMLQFRVELSVLLPNMKPALLALCKPLACDLPLPHKSDLISIESSDLHPDTRKKDQLVLAATIRNRAPFAQAYPDLELTLTDTADKTLLRRVLAPADYLAKEASASAGLAANGELAVNLALIYENAEDAPATGYRLYLFYP